MGVLTLCRNSKDVLTSSSLTLVSTTMISVTALTAPVPLALAASVLPTKSSCTASRSSTATISSTGPT